MRKYLDACIVYETKDMSKEQWLEARKCGIGGSDAASVLGLNPYKSSVSVYIEKVDYIHGVSMSEKNINGCKMCIRDRYMKTQKEIIILDVF